MFKLLKFSRTHWKKLIFACVPVTYGLSVLKTNYDITKYMRNVCNELKDGSNGDVKNILVVLNPVANIKKSEKMFTKYCEPLLHLAGFYVEIIKTTQVGHAKQLIESLETLPDAIVIAGGDGTASEVVTGLFRRNGTPCPIVILPLGNIKKTSLTNVADKPKGKFEYVDFLCKSVMPLIENRLRTASIFKYDLLSTNESKSLKPIYGLRQFSWGFLNEIEASKNKYWYFGPLRHYVAALYQCLFPKALIMNVNANIMYTPPCPGCLNCITTTSPSTKSKLLFSKLYSPKAVYTNTNKSSVRNINEECKMENNEQFTVNQIDVISSKNAESYDEMNLIQIKLPTSNISLFENIEGIVKHKMDPYKIINCRTIKIYPWKENGIRQDINSYYIDGEEYDVRPIQISLLPNAIQMFC